MKFIIVASPRTGSTLIAQNLAPLCSGEIWLRNRIAGVGWTYDQANKKPVEYFNKAANGGAKVMTEELTKMTNVPHLFSSVGNIIFLRRRNLTEQSISLLLANNFVFFHLIRMEILEHY